MKGELECIRIADHRRMYLDYQGPISGDRGRVTRHDQGHYHISSRDDGRWDIEFRGRRLRGCFSLVRDHGSEDKWRLSVRSA